MVNFLMINGEILAEDMFYYIENIVLKLQNRGLITNLISVPQYSVLGNSCSIIENNETTYIVEFIYSIKNIETHWKIIFEYGTFNSTSQLQIKITSSDYQLNIDDNYLEQLKLAVKNLLKSDWEKIIWLMDKDSEQLSIELYPSVYRVENLARQLISEIMTKEYGIGWWDAYVPLHIRNKHKSRLRGYKSIAPGFANVDERLMSIDIGDLNSIITLKQKKWIPSFSPEISNFLNDKSNIKMDQIKEILSNQMIVSFDLWAEQFSKYLSEKFISNFQTFELNRNHIVHNKLLDREAYSSISSSISVVESELIKALAKIEQVVISKEQREIREEQRTMEQEEMKAALKDYMESEAGVKIRSSEEIIEEYDKNLFDFYSVIQECFRFRNDLEIGEYQSIIAENTTGTLFEILYKINDESAIVKYSIEYLDDIEGSESVIDIRVIIGADEITKPVTYTNGVIVFNSYQGCYMPETKDEISVKDLLSLKEDTIDFLNDHFENLREKVDSDMFAIIKDGGNSPLAEFPCCECGEEYICINDHYGKSGQCLNCGEMNDVCLCDRCGYFFEGIADEDGPNLCENCLDYYNRQ